MNLPMIEPSPTTNDSNFAFMKGSNYTPFMGKAPKRLSSSARRPGRFSRSHEPSCTYKQARKFEDVRWREWRMKLSVGGRA